MSIRPQIAPGHGALDGLSVYLFRAAPGWPPPTVVLSGRVPAFETLDGAFAGGTAGATCCSAPPAKRSYTWTGRPATSCSAPAIQNWPLPPGGSGGPGDPAGRLVRLPTDLPSGAGPERSGAAIRVRPGGGG